MEMDAPLDGSVSKVSDVSGVEVVLELCVFQRRVFFLLDRGGMGFPEQALKKG